jgi:hypothetical protein
VSMAVLGVLFSSHPPLAHLGRLHLLLSSPLGVAGEACPG